MRFQLEQSEQEELACKNCGFILAESLEKNISKAEECVFCGSEHFYMEAPLDLSFLGRASICYVCETRYKGIIINNPEEKYTERGARAARKSKAASHWKERVEQYSHQAKA